MATDCCPVCEIDRRDLLAPGLHSEQPIAVDGQPLQSLQAERDRCSVRARSIAHTMPVAQSPTYNVSPSEASPSGTNSGTDEPSDEDLGRDPRR